MQTFAVLGAGGFIGYRLVEYLILNDLAIPRPVVRRFPSMARLAKFDLDIRIADALNTSALVRALGGCDVAFHCVVGSRDTILKSIGATYAACRQAGVQRLVYLSSAVVHGHDPRPGTTEDSPLIAHLPFEYSANKVLAERRLRTLIKDRTVESVVLRPSIVYGPRSTYFTARLAQDILAGTAFLVDEGCGICNTVFVDSLVEVMALCATHPAAPGHTFFVKDNERVTWRELYSKVAEAIGADVSSVPSISVPRASGPIQRIRNATVRMPKNRFFRAAKELVRGPATSLLANKLRSQFQPSDPDKVVAVLGPYQVLMANLQTCRYELPVHRLAGTLGYRPSISFDSASRRTAEWLRFAMGRME